MTDHTLFNEPSVTVDNHDLVDDNDSNDYLTQVVGDGKKFKDANALAKGKMQSDLFIQKLLAEKRDLEAKLTTTQSVEDLIKSLKNDQPLPNPGGERRDEETGFKPEDIQRIVEETVGKREEIARANRNLTEVTETLKKAYGTNYVQVLETKVEELGVGKAFLDDLARTNPKAFLSLIGVKKDAAEPPPSVFAPPASRINTTANPERNSGEKTYSYYEKIRKADPKLYSQLQHEMFQQAAKLGDAFYS
jgi:hypothetical protein